MPDGVLSDTVSPGSCLEDVGESFDEFKIKFDPDEEDEIQLRGRLNNYPFKIVLDIGDFRVDMVCKVPSQAGSFTLEYDKKKIPKQKEKDDPFAEEDEIRVFVDKGLFCEGDQEDIDRMLAFWHQISDDLTNNIKEILIGDKYGYLGINSQEVISYVWDKSDIIKRKAPLPASTPPSP